MSGAPLKRAGRHDRVEYKHLTRKVLVLRNGVEVGQLRYHPKNMVWDQPPGWRYHAGHAGPTLSEPFDSISDLKRWLEQEPEGSQDD